MKIKSIVVSGANEYTQIPSMLRIFSTYPQAEIGVQVSGKKAQESSARYWWLNALYYAMLKTSQKIPVALHINSNWVEQFCQGAVPHEVDIWLNHCPLNNGEPFIKRVQLNFKVGREKTPNISALCYAMSRYPEQRFILSYNEANAEIITKLYKLGVKFDCLYDGSFGEGILPNERWAPPFEDVLQGYAGGISIENVSDELDKIAKVVSPEREIFIDAEGKLKGEDGHLSLGLAGEYLRRASCWDKENNGWKA